jgi:hypothetical protein
LVTITGRTHLGANAGILYLFVFLKKINYQLYPSVLIYSCFRPDLFFEKRILFQAHFVLKLVELAPSHRDRLPLLGRYGFKIKVMIRKLEQGDL